MQNTGKMGLGVVLKGFFFEHQKGFKHQMNTNFGGDIPPTKWDNNCLNTKRKSNNLINKGCSSRF